MSDELSKRLRGDFNIVVAGNENSSESIVYTAYNLLPAVGFQVVDSIEPMGKQAYRSTTLFKDGQLYTAIPVFGYNASRSTVIETMQEADNLVKQWELDSSHVTRDDETHVYYIDGVAPNQSSVSKLGKESEPTLDDIIMNRFSRIGTLVDSNARYLIQKYFVDNGGEWASIDKVQEDFKNGKITVPVSFYYELQKFTDVLTNSLGKYGEDWKIISDPTDQKKKHYLYMDELYTDAGGQVQRRTRFGEMDFFVYTKDGRFFIIDMKTSNKENDTLS